MVQPTLYKTTKTGAIQVCKISTVKDVIEVEFGQLDGKMQFKHTVCVPKNVGRSNETTGVEQAEIEALAKWTKKKKEGYSEDITAPTVVQLPRKVGKWEPKRFKAGQFSTPKLNGINIIFRLDEADNLTLWSRGGDPRPPIPHLTKQVIDVMDWMSTKEINVELYKHGEHLQDIQSAVTKTNELSPMLEAAIFDICDMGDAPYSERNTLMRNAEVHFNYLTGVSFLTGVECNTIEEVEAEYISCLVANLEGTVIYSPDNIYVHNQRASDIWKYKPTLDAEFEVTNYEIDKNKCPVWVLRTAGGLTFKAKPKGEREPLQKMAQEAHLYTGKWATVEFEMLSKEGKPLKPVFLNFRDCHPDGTPKE